MEGRALGGDGGETVAQGWVHSTYGENIGYSYASGVSMLVLGGEVAGDREFQMLGRAGPGNADWRQSWWGQVA